MIDTKTVMKHKHLENRSQQSFIFHKIKIYTIITPTFYKLMLLHEPSWSAFSSRNGFVFTLKFIFLRNRINTSFYYISELKPIFNVYKLMVKNY